MSSNIEKINTAHKTYELLLHVLSDTRSRLIWGGKFLYDLKTDNAFKKAIGSGIDTWEDFLAMPEIGLSKGEAQRMMDIYEWFVLELDFKEKELIEVPVKSLHYLLPIAKSCQLTHDKMEELVEDAKVLNQKDLRERVWDVKEPEGERTYSYLIMKKCDQTGVMTKVHNVSSDDIIKAFKL